MAKLPNRSTLLELLNLLRIDVFFFLFLFGTILPGVTILQLVQDKYCLNVYNVSSQVCMNLEKSGPEYASVRNEILEKATTFKMYSTIITTAPSIIISLFLGYWIDSYPNHLKYLLANCAFGALQQMIILIYNCFNFTHEPSTLLMAYLASAFSGGHFVVLTGTYTYITRKTFPKYRSVRFAILEIAMFASFPAGQSIGGSILAMKPWFPNQFRNYVGVFLVGAVSSIIATIWIMIFLNDSEDRDSEKEGSENVEKSRNQNESTVEEKMEDVDLGSVDSVASTREATDEPEKKSNIASISDKVKKVKPKKSNLSIFLDIINIRNVIAMFKTCCRKRPNMGRACMWNLIGSMIALLIAYLGEVTIGFQFAQRVYSWNYLYYSYITSIVHILPAVISTLSPAIFIHKFHLHDSAVGIIGALSQIFMVIAKGGLLSPSGFYVSVFFTSFSGLLSIVIRSLISRIIDDNEIGQIYSMLSCIESMGPMVSTLFFSSIFNATIQNLPGIVYHAAAIISFYPLIVMVWLNLIKDKWDPVLMKERETRREPIVHNPIYDEDPKIIIEAQGSSQNNETLRVVFKKEESSNDTENIEEQTPRGETQF